MERFTVAIALLLVFILSSCNGMLTKNSGGNRSLSGDRPPNVNIKVNGEKYEVKLGSYCWGSDGTTECADTVGPVELLEGEEPIQVQDGE